MARLLRLFTSSKAKLWFGDSSEWRGVFWALLASSLYLAWLLFDRSSDERRLLVGDLIGPLGAGAAFVWSLWGIRGSWRGKRFLSPNLISLGIAFFAIADGVWCYFEQVLHQEPFPSYADVGYVASMLALMAGMLLSPRRPVPNALRARVLLDAMMIMAAVVTFSWYFTLGPTVIDAEGTAFAKVLTTAYPLLDLAALFCTLVMTSHPDEAKIASVRRLLCLGLLSFVAADYAFAYVSLKSEYTTGAIDAGWLAANLFLGFGAHRLRCVAKEESAEQAPATANPVLWRSLLPYSLVPAVVGLVLYVWRSGVHGALAGGVYVGATVLMGLVLVRQVFAIVENSRLYRYLQAAYHELEALATLDAMTGLPNHRALQERLRSEMKKSKDTGRPMTLLLLDVDRFKQYNDSFGHPAGDEALRLVAELLKANVREGDLAARYGGEEFAVILPDTDADAGVMIAEVIRGACERTTFPCRPVTLSVGVVSSVLDEAGVLIESADRALYLAKHGGRNQVCRADQELSGLPDGWSIAEGALRARWSQELLSQPAGPLLRTMLGMLNLRDAQVERRSDRAVRFCLRIAEEAIAQGRLTLTDAEASDLHLGALLHDIGKVGVPDGILQQPGALSEAAWTIVRQHPVRGDELLKDLPEFTGARAIVRSHHERWDGTGYPDRLAGESIPVGARVFAIADAMDAMWSDRPHQAALSLEEITNEIRRTSGTQFDPELVEVFLSIPPEEWIRLRMEAETNTLRAAA
ncbi:diguanylate cyclase [bacterium]|nr:MAG: diguanylate cyclase [bacterium]